MQSTRVRTRRAAEAHVHVRYVHAKSGLRAPWRVYELLAEHNGINSDLRRDSHRDTRYKNATKQFLTVKLKPIDYIWGVPFTDYHR